MYIANKGTLLGNALKLRERKREREDEEEAKKITF